MEVHQVGPPFHALWGWLQIEQIHKVDQLAEEELAAAGLDMKVVLIDGRELAQLMIENSLGVNVTDVYEVKQVDIGYFVED